PRIIILRALPLTPNGKVDRKALPAPEQTQLGADRRLLKPRNEIEEQLAAIWREVLKLEVVGVEDNFFELGGHSLMAFQVISRISEQLGSEVSFSGFFKTPTIAGLAQEIAAVRNVPAQNARVPLRPISRKAELPVSFVQERLWFLDQLRP